MCYKNFSTLPKATLYVNKKSHILLLSTLSTYYEKALRAFQIPTYNRTSVAKGQLISKAIYGLLTSPKKRTDEFDLFAFLLFMANKSNLSVCFLGESTDRQSAFWFYLTFTEA